MSEPSQPSDLQAQHDLLTREVALRTAELTALSLHLQTVREDERSRLARNLHDDLGALLTSAKLDVARLKPHLPALTPEAMARLDHLNDTLNRMIALKRRVVDDLWPATLSHLGLVTTLGILAREFTERSGIPVHCDLQPVALTPQAELVAYRVAQEAITNLSKHSQASQVVLRLAQHGPEVEITVQDDGVGFSASPGPSGKQPPTASHGLLAMRVRVEGEDGRLQIDSQPGAGCRVSARLPAAPPPLSA